MIKPLPSDYSEIDRDALERALSIMLQSKEPGRAEQVRSMLAEHSWGEVAVFAAYCCQCDHLRLASWQNPPCCFDHAEIEAIITVNDSNSHDLGGAKLLRKMLTANLSIFDPSPVDALAAAKAKRKRKPLRTKNGCADLY